MTKITINEAFVLLKALRGRLGELSSLRQSCASSETYYSETKRVVEPKYSVLVLDKRCVELENAILEMDTAIKSSNAVTKIEVVVDKNALLAPLT